MARRIESSTNLVGERVRSREADTFSFAIRRATIHSMAHPPNLVDAKDLPQLMQMLQIQPHVLQDVLTNIERHYVRLRPPQSKPGRKQRIIWKVERPLRDIHRQIKDWLNRAGSRKASASAFWKGSSPRLNADRHTRARHVTVADVRNFFGSITFEQVAEALCAIGCREIVAHVIAQICTFQGTLPQGARSSPVISNIVCNALDDDLLEYGRSYSLAVTRYVDDLTFSGESRVPAKFIRELLASHGFELRTGSYRCFSKGGPQFVTGLCVADHEHNIVRLPRKYKRWLRLEVHYVSGLGVDQQAISTGRDAAELAFRLRGHVQYARSVEPRFGEPLADQVLPILQAYIDELRNGTEDDDHDDYYDGW